MQYSTPKYTDVFVCKPEWAEDASLRKRYYALLDSDEHTRLSRFAFESDKHHFLVSHALVRVVLSRYADVPPEAWRFIPNAYGKPEIKTEGSPCPLRFSLSHTKGLVACAVTTAAEVGIDVEHTRRISDTLELAERFFAPAEAEAVRNASAETQTAHFFSIWTLKEAYIKARGMGLSLPLNRFAFELRQERIHVRFDSSITDEPENWSFLLLSPTSEHLLALAARGTPNTARNTNLQWLLPLMEPPRDKPSFSILAAT